VLTAGEASSVPVLISPINMTSATAPAPFVVTSKNFYDASYADWKAFDGLTSTACASNSRTPAPWWIAIDLGSPKSVSEYIYRTRGDYVGNAWRGWTLEGSNDNVNWFIVDKRAGEGFGAGGDQRTFVCPTTRTFRYWKWNVTDTPSDYADVGSLELWGPVSGPPPMMLVSPTNMAGPALPVPYVASASNDLAGYEAWHAFDGDPGPLAHSDQAINTIPYWIRIDLGSPKSVSDYKYQARNVGPYHCWKTWTLEGSNNGTTWTLVDTVVDEPTFAASEIRAYTCDAPSTFRYWSWNITQTSGISGTYCETATLELWGS
jgi:hypothetical protein